MQATRGVYVRRCWESPFGFSTTAATMAVAEEWRKATMTTNPVLSPTCSDDESRSGDESPAVHQSEHDKSTAAVHISKSCKNGRGFHSDAGDFIQGCICTTMIDLGMKF
ncbi:unnamed protein product [Linum trigynum]|uniref:Uncharacterized protein n=1 Tax=Linum trigynum TaxID=586398 RepID=A0AAV2DVV8_9ROSI